MKQGTFELIQQKLAETSGTPYRLGSPNRNDPSILRDPTRRQEPLLGWSLKMCDILDPRQYYSIKIPHDAEWYNGLYTNPDAVIEISTGQTQKLGAFVLRNKPFDMSEPVITTLVATELAAPDDSLLDVHPLLVVWAGPQGPFAAESPLLSVANSTFDSSHWQTVVSEVFAQA